MEFEPRKTLVRSIVFQELTQSGWVELIRIPIEHPEIATPEDIQKTLEDIHKMFYTSSKLELSTQEIQLCIRGLDQGGRTFRICASPNAPDSPQMVG